MKRIATLLTLVLAMSLMGCGGSSATPDHTPADTPAEEADETSASEAKTEDSDDQPTEEETTEEEENLPMTGDPNAPADVAAPPAQAEVTDSGLAYRILTEGSGSETPSTTSVVRVHYTGWTTDGVKFDSSVDRGQPAEFPLDRVIPGWTEGVSMMKVGEKRRLWIPVELAYNNRPGKPQGMLVFDVELLEIVD